MNYIVNGVKNYAMSVVPFDSITLETLCGNCTSEKYIAPISFWPPTKVEIKFMVESIKYAKFGAEFLNEKGKLPKTWDEFIGWHKAKSESEELEKPLVYDFGAGNGFLSLLLAMTGEVEVVGIDPYNKLVEEAKLVYQHPNLDFRIGEVLHVTNSITKPEGFVNPLKKPDAIFCSYMPPCIDFSADFRKIDPSCVIYVRNSICGNHFGAFIHDFRDCYGEDRSLESATENDLDYFLSFRTGKNLRRMYEWKTMALESLHSQLYGNCKCPEHKDRFSCYVDIQYRNDVPQAPNVNILTHDKERYAWELAMIDKKQFHGHLFKSMFSITTFVRN